MAIARTMPERLTNAKWAIVKCFTDTVLRDTDGLLARSVLRAACCVLRKLEGGGRSGVAWYVK